MKTASPTLYAVLATAALVLASAAPAQENVDLGQGYLCCNMLASGTWISDQNYRGDSSRVMIPFGTPLRHAGWGRNRMQVDIEGRRLEIGNDYSRNISMEEFGRRYLVEKDPRKQAAFSGASRKVRQMIESARVTRGMTRAQVIIALGYPTASENPVLEATPWKYAAYDGPFSVHFDARGLVTNVHGDPTTLKDVFVP